jgi:hypothetical protein
MIVSLRLSNCLLVVSFKKDLVTWSEIHVGYIAISCYLLMLMRMQVL